MCGIFGLAVSNKCSLIEYPKRAFIDEALICGTIRGDDSTGVCTVAKDGEVTVLKNTLAGFEFVQQPAFRKLMTSSAMYSLILGHHRYKTTGEISKRDAHPHSWDHITLVHNGTISNAYHLPGYRYAKDDSYVDSFRATMAMANEGASKTLPRLEGGYSLVWHDANESTVNFARNDDKPMYMCWGPEKESLFWASEPGMLHWLMVRNNIYPPKDCHITSLPIHTHIKFKLGPVLEMTSEIYEVKGFSGPNYGKPNYDHLTRYDRPNGHPGLENDDLGKAQTGGPNGGTDNVGDPSAPKSLIPTYLPATRKHSTEGPGVEEPTQVEKFLSAKRRSKLNRRLAVFHKGLTANAIIWGVPDIWHAYKNNHRSQGVGQFLWIKDHTLLHVHSVTADMWAKAVGGNLLVPISITGITDNNRILTGSIAFDRLKQGWTIADGIPDTNDQLKFVPFGLGEYISKAEYIERTKGGCTWCEEHISLGDALDVYWEANLPLCKICGEINAKKDDIQHGN